MTLDTGRIPIARPIMRRRTVVLLTAAVLLLRPAPHPAARTRAHEIQVVARRFAFEPAEIRVSAGEPVRLVIHAADGTHGLAIPTLHLEQRIPNDHAAVALEFVAPTAGRYEIECSEFCGRGHAQMKAALVSVAAPAGQP